MGFNSGFKGLRRETGRNESRLDVTSFISVLTVVVGMGGREGGLCVTNSVALMVTCGCHVNKFCWSFY